MENKIKLNKFLIKLKINKNEQALKVNIKGGILNKIKNGVKVELYRNNFN